jgi:hypothetical protein
MPKHPRSPSDERKNTRQQLDTDSLLQALDLMEADAIVTLCESSPDFETFCKANAGKVCRRIMKSIGLDYLGRNRSIDCEVVNFFRMFNVKFSELTITKMIAYCVVANNQYMLVYLTRLAEGLNQVVFVKDLYNEVRDLCSSPQFEQTCKSTKFCLFVIEIIGFKNVHFTSAHCNIVNFMASKNILTRDIDLETIYAHAIAANRRDIVVTMNDYILHTKNNDTTNRNLKEFFSKVMYLTKQIHLKNGERVSETK